MKRRLMTLFLGAPVLMAATSAYAVTNVLDQIPANPSDVPIISIATSQIFGAPNADLNMALIDDFTVSSSQTHLTELDAAVLGFNGFTTSSFAAITAWHVEVYSSVSAAAANLTGDVASVSVAPGSVTRTNPYAAPLSALVAVPLNISLPSSGTYYIGLIPDLNYATSGSALIGVVKGTDLGTPGGNNAFQVNPGGGAGFTDNQSALGSDAAYRLSADAGTDVAAVPLPDAAFAALPMLTALGIFKLLRRKCA